MVFTKKHSMKKESHVEPKAKSVKKEALLEGESYAEESSEDMSPNAMHGRAMGSHKHPDAIKSHQRKVSMAEHDDAMD